MSAAAAKAVDDFRTNLGTREMLRAAAASVEGILMRQVPGKESPIDLEILSQVAQTGAFHFKEHTGKYISAPMRFDAKMGRLDILESIDTGMNSKAIQLIRSGTDSALIKDYDPGSPYNRRVLELIAQVLALGIATEIEIGKPLPESARLYLTPLPTPEDSAENFIDLVVNAVARYRPQPINDRANFDRMYLRLIERLVKSGLSASKFSPDAMQTTVQQEILRVMVKVEVWRKLWRWVSSCIEKVADLRPLPAIVSDKKLSQAVRDLESSLKLTSETIGVYVRNSTAL
jgi:hypothetical protein